MFNGEGVMTSVEEIQHMRIVRDAYLKDMDGEVLKYVSMGQVVPDDIKNYLQSLRDVPATYSTEATVVWPAKP